MLQQKQTTAALERTVELSKSFIKHFHRRDASWCLSMCSPNITFIGAVREACTQGVDELTHFMDDVVARYYQEVVGTIDADGFLSPNGDTAVVTAHYLVASDPSSGHMLARQNQVTLVWDTTPCEVDHPLLRHVHVSALQTTAADGEDAQRLNRETYRYAKTVLDQLIRRSAISIRDTSGTMHYLAPAEVRYIEANRQRTVVHSLSETFAVRKGFKELVAEFGDGLVTVHRSYAVSPLHVKRIHGSAVVMDDGSEVPLPQRRTAEIRHKLDKAIALLGAQSRLREAPRVLDAMPVEPSFGG